MQPALDSIERLVPDALDERDATGRATLELHVARYDFAARHLRPGRVLDVACGAGYGARLLADRGGAGVRVLGVDISEEAVDYARRRYGGSRVEYRLGDALSFEDAEGFDTIVTLETLEHVADPAALMGRLTGMLRPGGVLVASVPTTPTADLNPHHCHDFTERSFRRLVGAGLEEIAALRQVQKIPLAAVLRRSEARMGDLRARLLLYYLAHPRVLLRRTLATLRYGMNVHYLTLAWSAGSGAAR